MYKLFDSLEESVQTLSGPKIKIKKINSYILCNDIKSILNDSLIFLCVCRLFEFSTLFAFYISFPNTTLDRIESKDASSKSADSKLSIPEHLNPLKNLQENYFHLFVVYKI